MALFDFLGGDDLDTEDFTRSLATPAPTFNPPAPAPEAGGISGALQDPNVLRMLAQFGSGFSQGQPFGQAAGTAAENLARNRALQAAAARGSQRQAGFVDQLIRALKGDPTGRNLLGPKEDRSTLDSITLTNDGINIKAPNPSITQPFADVTDESLEAQPGGDRFPFL